MLTEAQQQMLATLFPLLADAESVCVIVRRAGVEQQFDASWLSAILIVTLPVVDGGNSIAT